MNTQTLYKKWTIFFLIRAISEYVEAINLIKDLLSVDLSEEINVILCLNILAENLPEKFPRGKKPPEKGITTVFYKITIGAPSGSFLTLVAEKPSFDIKSEHDVAGFFKMGILNENLADQYMVFTWDHGMPYGIFTDSNPPENTHLNNIDDLAAKSVFENLNPLVTRFRQWDFYQSNVSPFISAEEKVTKEQLVTNKDLDMLTVTELKNAIKWAFGNTKIDILVMSNCNLQYFDTGFELCDHVKYLVAFESYMYFNDSLDYKNILQIVKNRPTLSAKKIAQLIVSTFEIKGNLHYKNGINNTQDLVALFANDLSWYPTMAKLIDNLASKLVDQLSIYYDKIKEARERCDYIFGLTKFYCLVDFKNFITALYNSLPGIFKESYHFFNFVLDQIVIESYVGSSFEKKSTKLQHPSCFSVYFPLNKQIYVNTYEETFINQNSKFAPAFAKEFCWDNFIKNFVTFGQD